MKSFSIVSIVVSALFVLLNLMFILAYANEPSMEAGVAFWGLLVSVYLLAYSIVSLVKSLK